MAFAVAASSRQSTLCSINDTSSRAAVLPQLCNDNACLRRESSRSRYHPINATSYRDCLMRTTVIRSHKSDFESVHVVMLWYTESSIERVQQSPVSQSGQ